MHIPIPATLQQSFLFISGIVSLPTDFGDSLWSQRQVITGEVEVEALEQSMLTTHFKSRQHLREFYASLFVAVITSLYRVYLFLPVGLCACCDCTFAPHQSCGEARGFNETAISFCLFDAFRMY